MSTFKHFVEKYDVYCDKPVAVISWKDIIKFRGIASPPAGVLIRVLKDADEEDSSAPIIGDTICMVISRRRDCGS